MAVLYSWSAILAGIVFDRCPRLDHPSRVIRRLALVAVPAALLGGIVLLASSPTPAPLAAGPSADPGGSVQASIRPAARAPSSTPVPIPGHEVYGYVPYWEMDEGIAAHVASTDLSTLALFSVTHGGSGALATSEPGYRRIHGTVGRRLIADAEARGLRVELVYTSFGQAKNSAFFGSGEATRERTIGELVALAAQLGLDGINVDVEGLPGELVSSYGRYVGALRDALRVTIPDAQVSVATTANVRGAAMARAAVDAGADRVFVMGYDYHWAGSGPGASAPLARRDGHPKDLPWSLDLYRDIGVPVERTILGLPLYGMSWPVSGPEVGASATGRGDAWIPRRNLDLLSDPGITATYDHLEDVEVIVRSAGSGWRATYYDSPASLTPKLAMADERGLAGAGFWAIGYERGLPDYTGLISRFRSGGLAPPR
jgi:hypothetical protein